MQTRRAEAQKTKNSPPEKFHLDAASYTMPDVPDMPELTPEEQLRADVLSICSALGAMEEYQEENGEILTKYAMGDECLGKWELNQERFWSSTKRIKP